ncbi:MAG: RnfABCDGE type electron transport complex subunit B [Clostridia bacterium]
MDQIIWPVVSLGGMGLIFGAGLAYASKKFAVETDPKVEMIREVLPGANCGGCGFPGCDGYAASVAAGSAAVNACPVGGNQLAQQIADIMGIDAETAERKIARVLCQGDNEHCSEKYEYQGIQDCVAASMLDGGSKSCQYGCLGLGACVNACPFDAIRITEGKIAVVDASKCTGCQKCVSACPKNLIEMVPESKEVKVMCKSKDKARAVREKCSIGCIGCRLCVRACQFDAIIFEDNLARIDYDKCTNCGMCAEKCPTKAIYVDHYKNMAAVADL